MDGESLIHRPSGRDDGYPISSVDPFYRGTQMLRLGAVGGLGSQPLIRGLAARSNVSLEEGSPGPLAARFEAEQFDCALLPVMDCVRQPLCRLIPGLGLCSRGETRTELLFAEVEPAKMRRVAVDPHAGGTVDLARVIFGETFDATPDFIPLEPEAFDPDAVDGLLVSGDSAWTRPNPYAMQFDLGTLWNDLTGLPLARMMWIGRFCAPFPQLRLLLSRAFQKGMAELDSIVAEAAHTRAIDADVAGDYFKHAVYYTAGEKEIEGIRVFARLAAKYGLCAPEATFELC